MTLDAESPALHDLAASGQAQAQYELGRRYAGEQNFSRARRWFTEAARQGHAGAMTELALFTLYGIGRAPDLDLATRMLLEAETAGSGEAAYTLGVLGWCAPTVPFDLDAMAARLRRAAALGHAPALRGLALVYARNGIDDRWIDGCLERAVALGDGVAAHLLALRLAARGDAERARTIAATAVALGTGRAAPLASGTDPQPLPTPDAWPEDVLPAASLAAGPTPSCTRWSDRPLVETYDGVLSALECEFIVALGEPHLAPSGTIDEGDPTLKRSDYRTSMEMSFYTFQEDFTLRWLQWRMVDLVGAPLSHAEHTVLLRYLPGQQYRPHRDYLPPSAAGMGPGPNEPGQRVNTLFCFLSEVESGGETAFPLQHLKIDPRVGRMVFFRNVLENGQPDTLTLHAGLPVVRGEKWLATLWTRERRCRGY